MDTIHVCEPVGRQILGILMIYKDPRHARIFEGNELYDFQQRDQ